MQQGIELVSIPVQHYATCCTMYSIGPLRTLESYLSAEREGEWSVRTEEFPNSSDCIGLFFIVKIHILTN